MIWHRSKTLKLPLLLKSNAERFRNALAANESLNQQLGMVMVHRAHKASPEATFGTSNASKTVESSLDTWIPSLRIRRAYSNLSFLGPNMVRIRIAVLASILGAASFFPAACPALPQVTSQTVSKVDGIPNWANVTDNLFRGGQPASAGYKALQEMGVGIVVDFRDEPGEIAGERRDVEALGMKYVSIPWSGSNKPSTFQVVQFLDLVRANPQARIFAHCKRGADRTGVMIAAYRIVVQHKEVTDAVAEMHQYHYDHFWLPQLERYVESLPQLLSSDPLFGAYASNSPKASASNNAAPVAASAVVHATPAESPVRAQ
jgi:protein tyrosine phosphatase (PTP) superfamily phosphohydrolase (DUF442 family)